MKIGYFFPWRGEVDPPLPHPSPGHQNLWSKSLSEHRFKAQIPSKNHKKNFVSRAPSVRRPHFWWPSAPKSWSTPPPSPTLAEKIWETTRKNRRETFLI